MKRFLLFVLSVFMLHSAFAVCNDTVTGVLIMEVTSPASGIQISWTPSKTFGVTYDIRILRVGYPGVQVYENIPIASYFIPYSDFYCGEHNFHIRVNCPEGTHGAWSQPVLARLISTDCNFDTPAACPGISLNAQASVYGFMPELLVPCDVDVFNITPTFNVSGGTVTDYTVSSIPYNPPYAFDVGTQIFINADDIFGPVTNLPFSFCFFEQTYNRVVVGANGMISFNASNAGQYNTWSTPDTNIPTPALANDLKNAIYGVMEDVYPPAINAQNPGAGIRWALLGTTAVDQNGVAKPCESCRTFVVNYYNVPLFSSQCNSLWNTYQMVLYEGSNIIDVYVEKRNRCPVWNPDPYPSDGSGGRGVIGVMNAAGTKGIAAPGRNLTDRWSTISSIDGVNRPEAWRFTPVIQNNNAVIKWYRGNFSSTDAEPPASAFISEGGSLSMEPSRDGLDTITVRLQIQSCNGCHIDMRDIAVVRWEREIVDIFDTVCQYNEYIGNGFEVPADSLKWERVYKASRNTYTAEEKCDTTYILNLKVKPRPYEEVIDTVCADSVYVFNGVEYTTAGYFTDTLLSSTGCDSIVILKLVFLPVPNALPPDTLDFICAGDPSFELQFTSSGGKDEIKPSNYSVVFDSVAIAAGFENQAGRLGGDGYLVTVNMPDKFFYPSNYNCVVTLYDPVYNCTSAEFEITFPVLYPASIMEQKWDNVIAIKNQNYNGGKYVFEDYQWFKNDEILIGHNGSYYYAGEGNVLDTTAYYYVALTRADSTTVLTCPFKPGEAKNTVSTYPTYIQEGNTVTVTVAQGKAKANLYTVTGILLYSNTFNAPSHTFNLPTDGVYLLDVRTDYGANKVFPLVVKRQ